MKETTAHNVEASEGAATVLHPHANGDTCSVYIFIYIFIYRNIYIFRSRISLDLAWFVEGSWRRCSHPPPGAFFTRMWRTFLPFGFLSDLLCVFDSTGFFFFFFTASEITNPELQQSSIKSTPRHFYLVTALQISHLDLGLWKIPHSGNKTKKKNSMSTFFSFKRFTMGLNTKCKHVFVFFFLNISPQRVGIFWREIVA